MALSVPGAAPPLQTGADGTDLASAGAYTTPFTPTRCCIFLTDNASGAPLSGVPVVASAQLVHAAPAPAATATAKMLNIPLGMLASDGCGYLSWDLEPLERQIQALSNPWLDGSHRLQLKSLTLLVYGPARVNFDALIGAEIGPEAIVNHYWLDADDVYTDSAIGIPSMQSPSLLDWYLSPGSFAHVPAELVGQDGCEAILPSNVATQEFQLHQVVLLPDSYQGRLSHGFIEMSTDGNGSSRPLEPGLVPLALVIDYDVRWIPVGHGLGQVAYSLPLAPGEKRDIAVVDWQRSSSDSRVDQTSLSDSLDHQLVRDRTVGEVVDATVSEWQRGGSVMAGIAGTVGAGAAAVGASQLLGASAAIGGGYATTSGDRNVTANTVQTLSDSVRQHSTALRDMRSTVVVQSQQAEHSSAQTRTVVNHNHAHAMTVLYYEVLRHYRVVIDRGTVRPAILLRQPMPPFTEDAVGTYRRFIEPGLLEPDLASGFDAIEKFNAWTELNPPVPPDPGAVNFDLFTLTIHVAGHYNRDGVNYRVSAILDSGTVELSKPGGGSTDLGGGGIRAGETDTFVGVPPTPVTWRSLRGLKVHVDVLASGNDPYGLGFDHISVHVRTTDGGDMVLCEQAIDWDTGSTKDGKYTTDFDAPIAWPGPKPVALTPVQRLSDGENLARVQLIHHLNANLPFYYRLIWLGEAPSDRYYRLSSYKLEVDGVARPLFGAVENRALDVLGDMTAFALDPELLPPEGTTGRHLYMPVIADAHSEQLVSLPTRGVFAEAKLGHCNAAEVIDNTRFWDWQSSPDPDQPPAISGVDLGSRDQQANTTPTPLPGSTLNIVNPPAAPDPVGMAGALALLGRSGLFTDMSMQNQVPALLGTLAADATAAGRSASSTAAASLPRGGGAGAGTGGGVVGSAIGGTRARPSDPSAINRDLQDLQGVLRQAQQSGLLTPEGAQAAYGAALSDALTPDLQQVGDIYVPPATTLNQLVGLIGEQILNAALKQKGFIVFADWRKHVSGNGIDVAALSPDGEVWYIDNKAWKRGISGADALTGDQFVVNQAEVEAFLQNVYSNKAEADAALAAIRAGKVRKVVSNGFAGEVTTFTKKCFDKGLSVFDLRFLRMFASHPEWFSAYSGLKVAGGLRKGMRLTGQRGCMTVEGTLVVFAVGAASGAAYLVTSGSDVNLSQIKGLAAQLVFDTVVGLLPGGFVAAFLTGLKSDADPRGQAALGLNDEVNALVDMLPGHENLTFEDLTSVRATIYDLMDSRFEFIEPAPRGGPAPAPGVFPPSPPPPGRWPPSPPPPGATT